MSDAVLPAGDAGAQLAREHEALLSFLYLAPVGLVHCTMDGGIAMLNPIAAKLLMPLAPSSELNNLFEVLQDVAPSLQHSVQRFAAGHGRICDAMRLAVLPMAAVVAQDTGDAGDVTNASSGSACKPRPDTLSLTLLKLDDTRLMAVVDDISEAVRRERMLEQGRAWFDTILTGISDYALVRLDAQGRVDGWNASIGRVTGLTQAQVQGQPYAVFYPPGATTPERLADRLAEARRDGWSVDDGWRQRADGSRFWGTALITPMTERDSGQQSEQHDSGQQREQDHGQRSGRASDSGDNLERSYHLIIRDIGERRSVTEGLLQSISRDHLTGLANRRAFFDAAELEVARWQRAPRPLSLVLFDADHFKSVNDRFGHPVGDLVLQQLAAAMQAAFRATDGGIDLVARIGGEEFAVLLPSTGIDEAFGVAERLRQQLADQALLLPNLDGTPRAPIVDGADGVDGMDGVDGARRASVDGPRRIRQTVSAGVASMDASVRNLQDLLQRADQALYAAKAAGRNRSCCWQAAGSLVGTDEALQPAQPTEPAQLAQLAQSAQSAQPAQPAQLQPLLPA